MHLEVGEVREGGSTFLGFMPCERLRVFFLHALPSKPFDARCTEMCRRDYKLKGVPLLADTFPPSFSTLNW